jgi:hypothetical protein
MTDATMQHLESPQDLRACLPLMRELRPHLKNEADFVERVSRMRADGYRLLAAMDHGQAVALAGYRVQENLIYGRFLYVDDLVVADGSCKPWTPPRAATAAPAWCSTPAWATPWPNASISAPVC